MTLVHRVAYASLFLSLAWFTVPRLAQSVREATGLWPLTMDQRRSEIFGSFYDSIERVDAAVPDEEQLPILVGPDPGPALFFNYYAYPQQTKFYGDFMLLRGRNVPRLVRIDGEARLLSYAEARAAEMGRSHIVRNLVVPEETRRNFIVPLASSGDGIPPDVWTIEAVMINTGVEEARVTVRMEPLGRTETITLQPGEKRTWNDFVSQLFGVLEFGWLHVESDQPLRARFWSVNRPHSDADVIPFAELKRTFQIPFRPKSFIWLVNPYDRELPVLLSGSQHFLAPRALVRIEWPHDLDVASEADIYVYQSWRDQAGNTHFYWPGES